MTLFGCCYALAEDPVELRDLDLKMAVEDTLYIMDPASPIGDESLPNGSLVNLVIHGGTLLASKSCSDPSPQ